jgi:HSP20 family protein
MVMARWQPIQDPMPLREALDRLFERGLSSMNEFGSRAAGLPMDMYGDEDCWVIEMAVPGLDPSAVNVSIEGNEVSISGEYPEPSQDRRYLVRERPTGRFERTIQFPSELDANKAEAECEHGMVRLTIPRAETARPRRIAVGSGATSSAKDRADGPGMPDRAGETRGAAQRTDGAGTGDRAARSAQTTAGVGASDRAAPEARQT